MLLRQVATIVLWCCIITSCYHMIVLSYRIIKSCYRMIVLSNDRVIVSCYPIIVLFGCTAQNSEIVKLYDLTSLTDDEESEQNPFRHPLAHLLFRVALKLHKKKNHTKSGVIEALLLNSLSLAAEARPQVGIICFCCKG